MSTSTADKFLLGTKILHDLALDEQDDFHFTPAQKPEREVAKQLSDLIEKIGPMNFFCLLEKAARLARYHDNAEDNPADPDLRKLSDHLLAAAGKVA